MLTTPSNANGSGTILPVLRNSDDLDDINNPHRTRMADCRILVCQKNAPQIASTLKLVNTRSKRHAITTYEEVAAVAAEAEENLDEYDLAPSYRPGALAYWRSPAPRASSYWGRANITGIWLKRTNEGWVLYAAEQLNKSGGDKGIPVRLTITERQSELANRRRRHDLCIKVRTRSKS